MSPIEILNGPVADHLRTLAYGDFDIAGIAIGVPPRIVIAFVGVLFCWFLIHYFLRGLIMLYRGKRLVKRIRRLLIANKNVPPESVDKLLRKKSVWAHLWSEYKETLHEQWDVVNGERQRVRVRATVPAESYFTSEVLVDTPLATEFFKHLPGILTGIGIIGTFYGLISGLDRFNIQLDPQLLQASIAQLMTAVKEAFIASGIAISAAMIVTLIEKFLLTSCYSVVENLQQAIDALYEQGAGEEYLARLVQSSEESAVQTRHLKDSLVDDLRQLLTELTERQIAASHTQGEVLAGNVGAVIRDSLAEPMTAISDAVKGSSSRQGDAVQGMLENLLSAFMEKLDGSIGGQMNGLQEMMSGTVRAMEGMRTDFANMVDKMGETSGRASQSAADQVVRLMAEAEDRQRQMSAALLDAVREMRQQVTGGQSEMNEQTARTLDQLRLTLMEMLEEIRRQREEASRSTSQGMSELRDSLVATVEQMRTTAAEMGQAGGEQLAKMLQMAEQRQASLADALRQALDEMGRRVADGNDALQGKTAESLDKVGASLSQMLDEIKHQRDETSKAARDDLTEMKTAMTELARTVRDSSVAVAEESSRSATNLIDRMTERQTEVEAAANLAQNVARKKLQVTMDTMATGLTSFLAAAEERERRQSESASEFQRGVAQRTAEVLEALDRRLGEQASSSARAVQSMQAAIDALNGATGKAIDGMSRGAETMLRAADGFTQAGSKIETTVLRTSDLLDRVISASTSLDMSVRAVESVVSSYNATRETLQALSSTLQGLVQDADARAGVGRELVGTMQTVVRDFSKVQEETGEYLDKVGGVLKVGFDSFADAVTTNMRRSHGDFHKSLSDAVQMISHQLGELDAILNGFTAKAKAMA